MIAFRKNMQGKKYVGKRINKRVFRCATDLLILFLKRNGLCVVGSLSCTHHASSTRPSVSCSTEWQTQMVWMLARMWRSLNVDVVGWLGLLNAFLLDGYLPFVEVKISTCISGSWRWMMYSIDNISYFWRLFWARICHGLKRGAVVVFCLGHWQSFGLYSFWFELFGFEILMKSPLVSPSCFGCWEIFGGVCELLLINSFDCTDLGRHTFFRMSGELHDYANPNAPPLYEKRMKESSPILISAMCWLLIYFFIIRPLKILQPSQEAIEAYDETGLYCRYTWFFRSWREYENIQ